MENRKNAKDYQEMIDTLAKQIKKSLQYSADDYDRTYISIIQSVNSNGTYDVVDEFGTQRNVVLAIPDVTLTVGQRVYITIPRGELKNMYISGVHPQIINR